MNQIDLTGYTPQEIEHLRRTEQKMALHEEIYWLADQLTGETKEVALTAIQRIAYLLQQGDGFEQNAHHWEAIATGATAAAKELERQRDLIADEYGEYINAVQAGEHPDVKAHIDLAYQDAFKEYQLNGARLTILVEKLKLPTGDEV